MARKEKKYHFIYKTTNLLSGRYYIGMHSTDNLEDGYLGSGNLISRAIKKHGKTNFIREILEFCESREELKSKEKEIVNLEEIAKKECMNLQVGGGGGFINEEHMMKCSKAGNQAFKEKLKTDKEFLKIHSERSSKTAKETYKNGNLNIPDWTGKKHSNLTKIKMSESKQCTGIGENNSQYGTCWVMKDNINKKIRIDEFNNYLEQGWVKGRKYSQDILNKVNEVNKSRRKVERPPYEQLLNEISKIGYKGCGEKYGVHSTAIKKWKINYERHIKTI